MQPIELDGITSSAVQSVQRPTRFGASWTGTARPRLLNADYVAPPSASTNHTVELGEQPLQREINPHFAARIAAQIRRVDDFVLMDGQRRTSALSELVVVDGQHRLLEGQHRLSFVEAVLATSMVSHGIEADRPGDIEWLGSPVDVKWAPDDQLVSIGFRSAWNRLESGYLLALALLKTAAWSAAPECVTFFAPYVEPLAIACGITRLSRPLVPRAPGPIGAAGRIGVGDHGLSLSLAA
ncbi:hypothetical protein [Kitasatospora cineracea]|uniref:hypothetical protein n=1 Tax=Kitasatospora cineracea TaxID=88074 RepID=UPI00340CA7FD